MFRERRLDLSNPFAKTRPSLARIDEIVDAELFRAWQDGLGTSHFFLEFCTTRIRVVRGLYFATKCECDAAFDRQCARHGARPGNDRRTRAA